MDEPLRAAVAALVPGDLAARTESTIGMRSWSRPTIRLLRLGGRPIVVKDFSSMAWLLRETQGRYLAWREERLYDRLRGIEGVPACYGRIGGLALALEHVDGGPIRREDGSRLTPEFFARLARLVAAVHSRGIAHLDLRQRRNVLLDREGRPWIVDFGSAVRVHLLGPVARLLFAIDRSAVLKWKDRFARDLLGEEEARRLRRLEAAGRFWPGRIFKILRRRRGRGASPETKGG